MTKLKIGFIGAGFIAQQCHLPAFYESSNCEIVSIADLHSDLANRVALKFEIPKVHKSHKELLSDRNIDAVVITLPRNYTFEIVKQSLLAGKHVLTEKPITLNFNNAKKLKEISIKKDLILRVGYMKRNDLGVENFKKLIKKNGDPLLVRSKCYMGESYCSPIGSVKSKNNISSPISSLEDFPSFLRKKEKSGYENFVNTFSHTLNLIEFIFDKKLTFEYSNVNSEGFGISLFSCGKITTEISTSKAALNNWIEEIEVVYPDKILQLFLPPALLKNVPSAIKIQKGINYFEENIHRPKWSWSFLEQAKAFIKDVNINNKEMESLDSAINVLKISEDIFKNKI